MKTYFFALYHWYDTKPGIANEPDTNTYRISLDETFSTFYKNTGRKVNVSINPLGTYSLITDKPPTGTDVTTISRVLKIASSDRINPIWNL